MIVADSSAVLDYLTDGGALGGWVEARFEDAEWELHAPHVLDVEVMNVLRRLALGGALSAEEGATHVEELMLLGIARYPHAPFLERIWELRDVAHAPDAAFIALAEALDVPLVTTDRRLARTHGLGIAILSP